MSEPILVQKRTKTMKKSNSIRYNALSAIFMAIALFLMTGCSVVGEFEEARYSVITQSHEYNIDIRDYNDALIAKVIAAGDRSEAARQGFRSLAKFIFGGNQDERKIAMTAPVLQTPVGENAWEVLFFMPSEFDTNTLPAPNDEIIDIQILSARKIAAIKFSGRWSEKNMNTHKAKLEDYLKANNIEYQQPAIYAFYNDPFTPWFLRHNEIMFVIE